MFIERTIGIPGTRPVVYQRANPTRMATLLRFLVHRDSFRTAEEGLTRRKSGKKSRRQKECHGYPLYSPLVPSDFFGTKNQQGDIRLVAHLGDGAAVKKVAEQAVAMTGHGN